jgi:metal-dependent hydrolase (beta-lactamase superfamily II)
MMKIQNGGQFNYAEKINGVLSDIHTLGGEETSERAVEIKRLGINTILAAHYLCLRTEIKEHINK